MPKPAKEIIVTGEQQADIDVPSLARVIVRFVRQRHSQADVAQPIASPDHTQREQA